MGVLANYLKTEADHLRAERNQQAAAVREWLTAIDQLYDQLEQWLTEADAGLGMLSVSRTVELIISEGGLGAYNVKCLSVDLYHRPGVVIVPRARNVIATIRPPGKEPRRADGMVEIKDGAVAEYYLYRLKEENGDTWFIRDVARWNAGREPQTDEPLDRDRFEAAILRVLK